MYFLLFLSTFFLIYNTIPTKITCGHLKEGITIYIYIYVCVILTNIIKVQYMHAGLIVFIRINYKCDSNIIKIRRFIFFSIKPTIKIFNINSFD